MLCRESFRRHLDEEYQEDYMNHVRSTLDSPLRRAVKTGNIARVRELINQNDINIPNYKNWTLIHESAVSDDLFEIFQYLISAGAKIQFKSDSGVSPFYVACRYGSLRIAKALLEAGCDVNERCLYDNEVNKYIPTNFSPLHAACIGNHKDMVQFLLENGANVNAKDCEGRTACFYASREKNVDTLRLLIDAGADLASKDIYGGSVFYHVCRGHYDSDTFNLLETYGFSFINDQTESGRTALMDASSKGNCTLAEELIKLGADTTLADNQGSLALHFAALSGYKIFKLLLQHTPADAIEKYATFKTDSERWRSLPCCVIENRNFDSLELLYTSDLSEAVLICPDESNSILLSPLAFLLATSFYKMDEDNFMDFFKFLLSFEFIIEPTYETVPYEPGKKACLKRFKTVEAVLQRHRNCYADWYDLCPCGSHVSEILSHSVSHNKMLPYGYSRQLDLFSESARLGLFEALKLLKYAEYVSPDEVLQEMIKKLLSDPFIILVGHEEKVIKFLLEKCTTNFTATFLEMKTLALEKLRFGASPMSPNIWRKYEKFLEISKMAESYNSVAKLEKMCRHTLRKSIRKKAEESSQDFETCLRSIPMPPTLYERIRFDL